MRGFKSLCSAALSCRTFRGDSCAEQEDFPRTDVARPQGRKAFYPTRLQTNVAMWLSTAKLTVPVPFAPFAAVAKIEGSMSFEELWPEYEAKMKAGGKESASDAAIRLGHKWCDEKYSHSKR